MKNIPALHSQVVCFARANPATPAAEYLAALGFDEYHTGGGCMSLALFADDAESGPYILVTDNDSDIPATLGESLIGLYMEYEDFEGEVVTIADFPVQLTIEARDCTDEFKRKIFDEYRVVIVDESNTPESVVFVGKHYQLANMLERHWVDEKCPDEKPLDDKYLQPAIVARMKHEIRQEIERGRIPNTVASFGGLHDYIDANELGGFCEDEVANGLYALFGGRDEHGGMPQKMIDFINACQDEIDAWVKNGGAAEIFALPGSVSLDAATSESAPANSVGN